MRNYIVVHSVRVCTEFTPETYGRLTTIGPKFSMTTGSGTGRRRTFQMCGCRCGNSLLVVIDSLRNGQTSSCGCLHTDTMSTHRLSSTPEYKAWANMRSRCDNPNSTGYEIYGGRGIGYCERWKKFSDFFTDMGLRPSLLHTLERNDYDLDYSLDNCCWADRFQQNNNTRANRRITINGTTKTIAEWCREYKMPYDPVLARITLSGWEPLRAFTTPIQKRKPKQ